MNPIIRQLLEVNEPSIHYGIRLYLLDEDPASADMIALQEKIRNSVRVQRLLSERDEKGEIPHHPYSKWDGAHWVLAALADLNYPSGDADLLPLRDQQYSFFFTGSLDEPVPARRRVVVKGQPRMCASIEGNGLFTALKLGIADSRVENLFDLLLDWRWPDGGWNCDKKPGASHSSFMETLIPLRAINLYYQFSGDLRAKLVLEQAADIFLHRRLFHRLSDGQVMDPNFIKLHYPVYWHYDILAGLKVMMEIGCINDPRCSEALDLLESKELLEGGFPAEARYYQVTSKEVSGRSLVDWGGTSQKKMNPWVTLDALRVLKKAGRITILK
jgi:hypothetical protein